MASQETMSSSFSCLVAWLLLLLLLPPLFAAVDDGMRSGGGSGSNCTTSCGNVGFEYPFGVEDGCYRAGGFNLTCNYSYQPPRLFLGDGGGVQVLDISVPRGWALINNTRMVLNRTWDQLVVGGPYSLSGSNKITLVGCNARVDLRTQVKVKHGGGGGGGDDTSSNLISSCTAVCPLNLKDMAPVFALGSGGTDSASSAACSGLGCCQASINLDISSSYAIQIHNLQELGGSIRPTDLVFISKEEFSYTYDMAFGNNIPEALPALLDWYISSNPSECTYASAPNYCLSANSFCQAYDLGYKCHCSDGYQGNPYIRGGCLDIDECGHCETYQCYGECINFPRGFDCLCYHGTDGDPRKEGGCLPVKHYLSARGLGLRIGLGVGGGTILLLIAVGAPFLSRKMKVRRLKRMRQTFFNQNHGLLLQRLISQNADISERMILSLPVLEKATNNFNSNHEVGGGGHGVVYKGILNLDVVAIKKLRIIVEREINDFINEMAILSQINHRNVVKLIGCCLETEVPLLVYEFITNGSLDQHLHVDEPISLSWKDRMRIAVEVARALTYLHSAATIPVFHRDIKACNILLDDHLTAKVSDFGASRYIPINQTEVTTIVQGMIGYLDPEYYYTGHLTDKNDVFSFGALIIELLTRKRPTYRADQGDSLVLHFASLVRQGQLVEILDPQVLIEGGGEVLEVALLARMCTRMTGQDRPTMREVELGLENLQVSKKLASHDTASSSHDVSQIQIAEHRMLATGDTEESSIQYSMEE